MEDKTMFLNAVQVIKTDLNDVALLVKNHITSLSFPLDSYLEDRLLESSVYKFVYGNVSIGYFGLIKDKLHYFYVEKQYYRYAPDLFEKIITEKNIIVVSVMTQDPLLVALMAEWDYEKRKEACYFTDSGARVKLEPLEGHVVFRVGNEDDIQQIKEIAGDFFSEVSGGFDSLEERIAAKNIFVLKENNHLLGIGIIEKSQFNLNKNQALIVNNKEGIMHKQADALGVLALGYEIVGHGSISTYSTVSIGMFVNPNYRKKGIAKTILINLKKWAYENDLRPVAGCWYYNTLSRKSLEAAGMIATSIGYDAILKGKEKLPLRTGNPPGEAVE